MRKKQVVLDVSDFFLKKRLNRNEKLVLKETFGF